MGCNCGDNEYNIEIENNGSCEPTTPIYNISLGNVGVSGFSPKVNFVNETTSGFQIQTIDINGEELSGVVPKLDYINDTFLTQADAATTYLTVNGSNANNPISINGINLRKIGTNNKLLYTGSTSDSFAITTALTNTAYLKFGNGFLELGDLNYKHIATISQKAYYTSSRLDNGGSVTASEEIATVGDIGNGTITLTQGGVTKGTFTTNQSGNTTIDLDAGGTAITNPLEIIGSNNRDGVRLGVASNRDLQFEYFTIGEGGETSFPIKPIVSVSNPLNLTYVAFGLYGLSINEMTGATSSTNGTKGIVPAPSAGDENKFLAGDGTWKDAGGGGSVTNPIVFTESSTEGTRTTTGTLTLGLQTTGNIDPDLKIHYVVEDTGGGGGGTFSWDEYLIDRTLPATNGGLTATTNSSTGRNIRSMSVNVDGSTLQINSSGQLEVKPDTFVQKSGDTMTGNLVISQADVSQALILKDTTITKGTAPSTSKYSNIINRDSANSTMSLISSGYLSNGGSYISIRAIKPQVGSSEYTEIIVGYNSAGNPYAQAPTPAANSNGTNIATTAWVRTWGNGKQDTLTAGDAIDITSNVIGVKIDGTSITLNADGELQSSGGVPSVIDGGNA